MSAVTSSDDLVTQVVVDLRDGGTLAACLPKYQQRPAQLTLARAVAEAIATGATLIGEAGTGTGKTWSYLIPAIRSDQVAVVSTANKALQDQLFGKDIPFLQWHLRPFEAALMKGMGNYVCQDRLEQTLRDPDQEASEELDRLLAATRRPDFSGDLESLPFLLPAEIRARVNGDADQCAGKACEFYASCYIYAMREQVKQAQIIVVNHTLLLLDALLDHALLPDHDLVVIDEAHHLEAEATAAFTQVVTPGQVAALLSRHLVQEHTESSTREAIKGLSALLWQQVEELPWKSSPRHLLVEPIPEALVLSSKLDDLARELRANRPVTQDEKERALYDKLVEQVETLARTFRQVFDPGSFPDWVAYAERVERAGGRSAFQACLAPLSVAHFLRDKLFDKPAILVSATLATGAAQAQHEQRSPFAYFRQRVGLADVEVQECILPYAFDYERRALLYLPSPQMVPEPVALQSSQVSREQAERYLQAMADQMWQLIQASSGRAFLLFSSKRMLQECYERLAPRLAYPLFRQGDLPRAELVRRFSLEAGAVLFGLKTFWEGVDIAGEALSLVVIDKLPFAPPDDPVDQRRVNRMKAEKKDWFGEYVLPRVILDLKQGIGRLLRTDTDRGVIALLDTRLTTRGYGRRVLEELPPARRTRALEDVRAFFDRGATDDRVC